MENRGSEDNEEWKEVTRHHKMQKGKAKILSSGRVVGDPELEPDVEDAIQQGENKDEGLQMQEDGYKDNMALVAVPTAVQTDESNLLMYTVSPNSTLHNIITHNIDEVHTGNTEVEYVVDTNMIEGNKEQEREKVEKHAGGNKTTKSAKQGKKQATEEENQIIRVQPKRNVLYQYSR
ncbi:hypothetical protein HAX54_036383 [Datura stramonium]|uniref:Uncharacterized protein n=1 Tax=Datura stramonium TaxID=4076 RepID=A0ABS8SG01_DATST|nr:hypothetical protein [Datura stramonium]